MLPMFKQHVSRLFYNGKLCGTRRAVCEVLQMAHDSKVGGYFKFSKTLSCLSNFQWKHKSRHVRKYYEGFLAFQQYKNSSQSKLMNQMSLEMSTWR